MALQNYIFLQEFLRYHSNRDTFLDDKHSRKTNIRTKITRHHASLVRVDNTKTAMANQDAKIVPLASIRIKTSKQDARLAPLAITRTRMARLDAKVVHLVNIKIQMDRVDASAVVQGNIKIRMLHQAARTVPLVSLEQRRKCCLAEVEDLTNFMCFLNRSKIPKPKLPIVM